MPPDKFNYHNVTVRQQLETWIYDQCDVCNDTAGVSVKSNSSPPESRETEDVVFARRRVHRRTVQ